MIKQKAEKKKKSKHIQKGARRSLFALSQDESKKDVVSVSPEKFPWMACVMPVARCRVMLYKNMAHSYTLPHTLFKGLQMHLALHKTRR